MLVERGFVVGSSIMHKEDKTMACIQAFQGSFVQIRTATSAFTVPVEHFLEKIWVRRESHSEEPDELLSWMQHGPLKSMDFKLSYIKAAILTELHDLTVAHPIPVDIKLFNKPKNVVAAGKFDKGKLVFVPSTTKVSTTSDNKLQNGSFCVAQLGQTLFSINPLLTLPGSKQQPFLAPFWFVQCSSEADEVNMELVWKQCGPKDGVKIKIPLIKNSAVVHEGDRLVLGELTDGDRGLIENEAKDKGKKGTGSSTDRPAKKGKKGQ
jgi:hypothetical protein